MIFQRHIADLLLEHNCVIVPGLGAFIGNYQPARLNTLSHKIYPPRKKVTFNASLTHNDGLLINHISRKLNRSYEEVEQLMHADVVRTNQQLYQEKAVAIDKVGRLFKDSLNNLRFEPAEAHNLLKEAFGLTSIFIRPFEQEKEQAVQPALEPGKEYREEQPEKAGPKVIPLTQRHEQAGEESAALPAWRRIAVAAAFIPLVAYLVYVPTSTNLLKKGNFHVSELNPFTEKVCEVYKPRELGKFPSFGDKVELGELSYPETARYTDFSLYYRGEVSEKRPSKTVRLIDYIPHKIDSTKVAMATPDETKPYQVVVGCFSIKSNATGLVAKLRNKGYNAGIIDYWKGLYRVRIDSYSNKSDALDALMAVKAKENDGAWILRK